MIRLQRVAVDAQREALLAEGKDVREAEGLLTVGGLHGRIATEISDERQRKTVGPLLDRNEKLDRTRAKLLSLQRALALELVDVLVNRYLRDAEVVSDLFECGGNPAFLSELLDELHDPELLLGEVHWTFLQVYSERRSPTLVAIGKTRVQEGRSELR